jgi:alpha-glucosidase
MLGLAGASYLYQGEELGLPEHTTLAPEFRQDPTFARTEGKRVGRDGCRVPLPWQAGVGAANGFNTTGKSWLPQPELYRDYARDQQDGVAGSTLELYKSALRIRRELRLGEGSFEWLTQFTNEQALGYRNGDILVIHNFGIEPLKVPAGDFVLRSGSGSRPGELAPNETIWLRAEAPN